MTRYRKKPVAIDAHCFRGTMASIQAIKLLFLDMRVCSLITQGEKVSLLRIGTLDGGHAVNDGDYIIRGVAGEYYPCSPAIFAATYELVE